jgi:hypothetical protein
MTYDMAYVWLVTSFLGDSKTNDASLKQGVIHVTRFPAVLGGLAASG